MSDLYFRIGLWFVIGGGISVMVGMVILFIGIMEEML